MKTIKSILITLIMLSVFAIVCYGAITEKEKSELAFPCKEIHEIDKNGVDWGDSGCRYITFSGLNIFNNPNDVIVGFRPDGIVVWKHIKGKGETK